MQTHTHTHICTHMHLCTRTYTRTYTHTYTHTHTHIVQTDRLCTAMLGGGLGRKDDTDIFLCRESRLACKTAAGLLLLCHRDPPSLQNSDPPSLSFRDELKREQRKLQRDIKDFKKRSNTEDKAVVKPEVAEEAEEKKDEDTEGTVLLLEMLV